MTLVQAFSYLPSNYRGSMTCTLLTVLWFRSLLLSCILGGCTSSRLEICLVSYGSARLYIFMMGFLLSVCKYCILWYFCILDMKIDQRLSLIMCHLKYLLICLIKIVLFRCGLRLLPSSSLEFIASFLFLAWPSVRVLITLRWLPLMMAWASWRIKCVVLNSDISLGLFDVEVELFLLNFFVCMV